MWEETPKLVDMGNPIIQGAVLEWAIEEAGIDRAHVIASLDSSEALQSPASGPISVSEADLRTIAKATRRSPYFFALPLPPAPLRSATATNFRAPTSNNGEPRGLTSEERFVVRQAKRRQDIAVKIAEKLGVKPIELLPLRPNESPQSAAARVAVWLGWEVNRKKHSSKSKLFVALRGAIEDHGILTNLIKVEDDSFRGFALHHEHAPLILVNAAVKSAGARSFTLLHELAHLLRGVDKACSRHDLQARTTEEAWCNRFAAAFLMPAADVRTYLEKYPKKNFVAGDDLDTLRLVSNYFRTSYFAAAIRLKELGLANEKLVKAVSGSFQEQEKPGRAPGKTRPELRLAEFGKSFARLVDEGLSTARVSELEARKLFRIDSEELRTLRRLGQVSA